MCQNDNLVLGGGFKLVPNMSLFSVLIHDFMFPLISTRCFQNGLKLLRLKEVEVICFHGIY